MPDPVLTGLLDRRATLATEAATIRARLQQLDVDVANLDAVLRQLDPEYRPADARAPRVRRENAARPGERSRLLLDVLRSAGEPLDAAEIVRRTAQRMGEDASDPEVRRTYMKRVETALGRQEKAGTLRSVREIGRAVTWEVAG